MSKLSTAEFTDIIQAELPMAAESGVYLTTIEHGRAEMILPYNDNSVRPGGTIAGPQR